MIGKVFGKINSTWDWLNADTAGVDQAIVDGNQGAIEAFLATKNQYLQEYLVKRLAEKRVIDQEMLALYQVLSSKIDDAAKLAHRNRKPLLILIGEEHVAVNSAIVEAMILRIVAEKYGIKEVFSEAFDTELFEHSQALSLFWKNGTVTLPAKSVEAVVKELGMKKIPMDYALYNKLLRYQAISPIPEYDANPIYKNEQVSDARSANDMQKRHKVMVDVMSRSKNNKVAIVGLDHLDGLTKENKLTDQHTILLINAFDFEFVAPPYIRQRIEAFLDSAKVYHAQVETLNRPNSVYKNAALITPAMIAQKSQEIHQLMRPAHAGVIEYKSQMSLFHQLYDQIYAPVDTHRSAAAAAPEANAKPETRGCIKTMTIKVKDFANGFMEMDNCGKVGSLLLFGVTALCFTYETRPHAKAGLLAIGAVGIARLRNQGPVRRRKPT